MPPAEPSLVSAPRWSRWLALPLVALLAIVGFASIAGASQADDDWRAYQLVNNYRQGNGRSAIAFDEAATSVARRWAQHMAARNSLGHNPNLDSQVRNEVTSQATGWAENVGYAGSIDQVQAMFQNSSGHRGNLLGNYNRLGVGVAYGNGRVWVAQVFVAGPALPVMSSAAHAPFNSPPSLVRRQYEDFLGRGADDFGLLAFASGIMAGSFGGDYVGTRLATSGEFASTVAPVARLYDAYFLRLPDPAGLDYWIGRRRAGLPLEAISSNFAGSQEFRSRYGNLTNRRFVELVYQNVLQRNGDADGLAYWTGELDAGRRDRGGVMLGFSESPEFVARVWARTTVAVTYLAMLDRTPDSQGLAYWQNQLNQGGSVQPLIGGILGSGEYRSRVN